MTMILKVGNEIRFMNGWFRSDYITETECLSKKEFHSFKLFMKCFLFTQRNELKLSFWRNTELDFW